MNIKPSKDRQGIRLQFTVESAPFSFAPLKGGKWENKRDRQLVAAIATKIENDILAGHFDPSLEKYRHRSGAEIPLVRSNKERDLKWLDIWDKWVGSLQLPLHTASDHYACVRAMIVKAENPPLDDVDWLLIAQLGTSSFNRRLSMLRSCLRWAVEEGLTKCDPLKKVRSRLITELERQSSESKTAPFSDLEIQRILRHIDEFYSSYGPFVRFLFFSGARTGEVVGLTWENIDLEKRLIFIRQSISRQRGGYEKISKSPKTKESIRTLMMSNRIFDLLKSIATEEDVCGLIFKSPKGRIIDHGNFRTQCWMPTLRDLNIPYRKPYATRHTLLSQALESGLSVPQVAQIAGHRDGKMIVQHYGHVINRPCLPE